MPNFEYQLSKAAQHDNPGLTVQGANMRVTFWWSRVQKRKPSPNATREAAFCCYLYAQTIAIRALVPTSLVNLTFNT
jgi:hypothetical protein